MFLFNTESIFSTFLFDLVRINLNNSTFLKLNKNKKKNKQTKIKNISTAILPF